MTNLWRLEESDLADLDVWRARDLVALCFYQAQRETLGASFQGAAPLDDLARKVVASLRVAFVHGQDDMDHPTPAGLSRAVELLASQSRTWGTPERVVAHHAAQIGMVLRRLRKGEERAVEDALERRIEDDLERGTLSLPPLPGLAAELHRLSAPGTNDLSKVVELVQRDPQLAAAVLALANSAAHAPSGAAPMVSLRDAAVRIGLAAMRNLAYAVVMGRVFRCAPLAKQMRQLQQHNFVVACGATAAWGGDSPDRDTAFLAGLFHDVGSQLILARLGELGSQDAAWLSGDTVQAPFTRLHQRLGRMLVTKWQLPEAVADVAGDHHCAPGGETLSGLVALVNAAAGLTVGNAGERAALFAALYEGTQSNIGPEQLAHMARAVHMASSDPTLAMITS